MIFQLLRQFLFLSIFGLMHSNLAFAAQNEGKLTVALPQGDYLPHYGHLKGRALGYLPALVNRFESDTSTQLNMVGMPIRRYILDLQSGKVDFVMPSNPQWTDNHANNLTFSSALMKSRAGYVRLSKNAGKPIRYVATPAGYTLSKIPPEMQHKQLNVVEVIDLQAALGMLKAERVDAVFGHLDIIRRWKDEQFSDGKLIFEDHAGYDDYSYHLSTIRYPDVIVQFDNWLKKNQGVVQRLKKHFGIELTKEEFERASVVAPLGASLKI